MQALPTPLRALDAAGLRAWCAAGLAALADARQEIDGLNVYPVPDGDTGTNLHLTLAAVVEALESAQPDLASTARALVSGSLLGARGNSGVILSQLLRGFGDVVGALDEIGPAALQEALSAGAAKAYAAVASPVEGTLLTVAREAAEGAEGDDLAAVVRAACTAAEASLARTPDLLPVLRDAGVVDAGGRGWCVLLRALEGVVTGCAAAVPPPLVPRTAPVVDARESGSDAFAYEVQFLLRDTTDAAVAELRARLADLGDSLVVVGAEVAGGTVHNVHVHVDDVGAALEAAVDAGRPFRISVTRFADQVAPCPRGRRAVVAVAPDAGLARLLRDVGAHVVEGGATSAPSTQQLLDGIRATGAAEVVLLPGDGNVHAAAALAAELAGAEGVTAVVLPTRCLLQGLAALSVRDADLDLAEDLSHMGAAVAAVRWAEVTTAVRDAVTAAGPCRAGDVLGLLGGEVVEVGTDAEQVALALLDRLLSTGGELVTVVLGAPAQPGAGDRLTAYAGAARPSVEVVVLSGGQPHAAFLLGVE